MKTARFDRFLESVSIEFLSLIRRVQWGRGLGGLASVFIGYKLFVLGTSRGFYQTTPTAHEILWSGSGVGLLLLVFGILVLTDKLEQFVNGHMAIIASGIASIFLGFLLFEGGVIGPGTSDLRVENAAYKFILSGQGPGLFFMAFGAAILAMFLWTTRPQKDIIAAEAERTRVTIAAEAEQTRNVLQMLANSTGTPFSLPNVAKEVGGDPGQDPLHTADSE